jgi:hypothetical protein
VWPILTATANRITCLQFQYAADGIWYLNNNVRIGSAYGPTLLPGWTWSRRSDLAYHGLGRHESGIQPRRYALALRIDMKHFALN